MKRMIIVVACTALCLLPAAAWAGIDGTDHDRGGQICKHCHIPHNAQGEKLWVSTPGGTGIGDLCYTCHDGTVTNVGDSTAFNANRQQHVGIAANGSPGDCDGCHDVHNQNPDLTGKFLYLDITETDGQYCTGCHGATPANADYVGPGGDHRYGITGTTNHYTTTGFNCMGCHTPHGAVDQAAGGVTNPILLDTMVVGGVYGDFCVDCHNNDAPSWPPTGWVTNISAGGVAAADVHNYAQATLDGTEISHPTTAGTIGGCDGCHDVHSNAADAIPKLLTTDNTDGAFCESCHTLGTLSAPTIGTSHPANVDVTAFTDYNDTTTAGGLAIPWALEINDDPSDAVFAGVDYPDATADFITCESCHSVHRQGVYGPLLRESNAANELCGLCHPLNY